MPVKRLPPLPGSLVLLLAAILAACAPAPPEETARPQPTPALASVPAEGFLRYDPQEVERDRLDPTWRAWAQRDLERRQQLAASPPFPGFTPAPVAPGTAAPPAATPTPTPTLAGELPVDRLRAGAAAPRTGTDGAGTVATTSRETWDAITPEAFGGAPALPLSGDAAGPTALRAQQLLDRVGFSPGVVDGHWGKNSEKAVFWLQVALGEAPTGILDQGLYERLVQVAGGDQPLTRYTLTADDVAGPFQPIPDSPAEQSQLSCLCYESAAEEAAERFHTTPELLARLNPGVDLAALREGVGLVVPNVEPAPSTHPPRQQQPLPRIARLVISRGGRYLQALDTAGNILLHFPATLGAGYDPSPGGDFTVTRVTFGPDFQYQPKLFAEVPDTEPEYHLPPGPNAPVGSVWIALSKEHYGIHGTAEPQTIGYASSHGCVRMTNWDATFLADHVPVGTTVEFRD
ncbi:MAG TPA: L,D-transpeptidase [Thermoanaerobaculia bacterium]|jgi:lipoprotein-anchoring transpeptidase ErfK/SrfK|nr:L,D-transpeptidase [Thermoanaerobaculia bacterium]